MRSLYRDEVSGFYPYHLQAFLGILLVLGLPVALAGAVLPLMFHALRERVTNLGDVAGRLYSWNTFGSLLGALIGGYALLFWLDLHHTFRIAMAAIALAAMLATLRSLDTGRLAPALILVSTLSAIALLPAWDAERLSAGLFRTRKGLPETFRGPQAFFRSQKSGKLRFYDDDPVASIAVMKYANGKKSGNLAILSNGKSDGAIPGDYVTTALLALLPALMARAPERAFVVGFGTGVTAGELCALEEVREVVVAEISPAVIQAAPLFDRGNLGASNNLKLHFVRGDAYRTLLRSQGLFDLIVSEPSNPWVTGVEMLYSREFLEAARDHLTPGGVHAQWFHSYETDSETIALVLRTYQSVFQNAAVWFTVGSDLLLIGLRDPETATDLERLARRFERPDFRAGFTRARVASLPALLAHEILPVGVLAATPLPGELHTLLHPRLSNVAARAFFVGGFGALTPTLKPAAAEIGRRNSLLARYTLAHGGALSEPERLGVVEEACRQGASQCAPLLARWIVEAPVSAARDDLRSRIALNRSLAHSVRLDTVDQLVPLFDGAPGAPPAKVAPADALRASELYAELYHHAVPFSREALTKLWRRCEADPKQQAACFTARLTAEQTLGDLGV